jgi:hypothetical protein
LLSNSRQPDKNINWRQAKLAVEHKLPVDKQESCQVRMAVVLQGVHEGIMAFDEEMKRLEINDAAARLHSCQTSLKGLTPKQIRGQCPPLDIIREMFGTL